MQLGIMKPQFLFGTQAWSQTFHDDVYTRAHRTGLDKQ